MNVYIQIIIFLFFRFKFIKKCSGTHFHPMQRYNDSIYDHDIINLNKMYTINLLEIETE